MKTAEISFSHRIGPDPKIACVVLENCPDLWELSDGSFVVIGEDITEQTKGSLPAGMGCGPSERVVRVPRELLVKAAIPKV